MRFLLITSVFTASLAPAVELRVATFNIGAHFGETFFDYSLGAAGTPDHDTVRDILARMDADVVALQEIHSVDLQGSPDDLDDLAASAGYPYLHVPPVTGAFDTSLRVVILSRFPFLATDDIGSPAGAKEVTRLHPAVKIDVPGTSRDPLIISAHLKAGTTTADRFRRAVEMKRLTAYLSASGLTNDDNFIILGDFNPSSSNTTFSSLPSGLPGSFVLGGDISFPVSYSTNPLSYFTTPTAVRLDPRQRDGSASTYGTTSPGGPTLDLLLVSPAIAGRLKASEVYNSALDDGTGLVKAGALLAASTSATASDHYAVFADLELDGDYPDLQFALSANSIVEGMPDGTVSAMVTLPATRPQAVTVNLVSDDPASASPASSTLMIPAGSLSANVALRVPRNFIEDGSRSIAITAESPGYDPDSALLQIDDVDGPYGFVSPGQTVVENFTQFAGDHDPAPWAVEGGATWKGVDDGSASSPGWRSYGPPADPSLGCLPDAAEGVASAAFVNHSPVPITALAISFDAEQWRSALGGTADTISVDLVANGQVMHLVTLSHAASQSLPAGAVAGGVTTSKSAFVTGLSIPPDATFGLKFTFTRGPGGGTPPGDIFINEFHYDNVGDDANEFIEVVVAPGFSSALSDIDVVLYNGATPSAAVPYGSTLNLADFDAGATSAGYRFLSKVFPKDGIQSGGTTGLPS